MITRKSKFKGTGVSLSRVRFVVSQNQGDSIYSFTGKYKVVDSNGVELATGTVSSTDGASTLPEFKAVIQKIEELLAEKLFDKETEPTTDSSEAIEEPTIDDVPGL